MAAMKVTLTMRLGALLVLFPSIPSVAMVPISSGTSLLQHSANLLQSGGSARHEAKAEESSKTLAASPVSTVQKVLDTSLGHRVQPALKGHFLTNTELEPINTIACLQAKQMNPAVKCANVTSHEVPSLEKNTPWSGQLSAGNFPSYKDPVCQSNGEFLCDPHDVLSKESRLALAEELRKLRESTPITCGQFREMKVDPVHYQPFYLGVVILKHWPLSQSNPDYLQQLGQLVAAQWNMDKLYVGGTIPYLRCPNTGILFIFPENDHVYLSTESCRFICPSKGGPEVSTAAVSALRDSGGAYAAGLAGVRTLYAFLKATETLPIDSNGHITQVSDTLATSDGQAAQVGDSSAVPSTSAEQNGNDYSPLVLRGLFVLSLAALCFSLAIAVIVFLLAPGLVKKSIKK